MCLEKIKFKKAKLIIVAKDTANNTKEKFKKICEEYSLNYYEYGDKEELSKAIRQSK